MSIYNLFTLLLIISTVLFFLADYITVTSKDVSEVKISKLLALVSFSGIWISLAVLIHLT